MNKYLSNKYLITAIPVALVVLFLLFSHWGKPGVGDVEHYLTYTGGAFCVADHESHMTCIPAGFVSFKKTDGIELVDNGMKAYMISGVLIYKLAADEVQTFTGKVVRHKGDAGTMEVGVEFIKGEHGWAPIRVIPAT